MQWFANLKTSSKLIIGFGALVLLLIFVIASSLRSLHNIVATTEDLYQKQFITVKDIMKMDDNNNNIEIRLLRLMIINDKLEQDELIKMIAQLNGDQEKLKAELSKALIGDESLLDSLNQFVILFQKAKSLRDDRIFPALHDNHMDVAKHIILSEHKIVSDQMSDLADKMTDESNIKANAGILAAKQEIDKAQGYFFIAGLLGLLLSIILIYVFNRLMAVPLKQLAIIAERIANKNLIIPDITFSHRKDEVGILGNTFEAMVKNLKELTFELNNAVSLLNTSSNEIVTASNQLATSATETAASINETTATIEEVKQTSQVASKKAKSVSEASEKTTEKSNIGEKSTNEMNDVISEINRQMHLIAETMMKLSEQTQTVGTIISTVEDLSQQTNLLAVNASIEASKAQEHGKGFSVVAQEVKSLATQSKQATNQIRTILNDIQKATSAAVMATELGSKAVDMGVKKKQEARDAIIVLIKTISENSQAASQIAAVNHQQLIGMEQATLAMESIKQAGSQNVESAKLLKDSTLGMQELSSRLKQIISQFKM